MTDCELTAILDPLAETIMLLHDGRIGEAEIEFRQLAGLNGDEGPAELAWLRMHDATAEMYDDVTKAAFWAGVAYGLGGGQLSEIAFEQVLVGTIG